MGVPAPGSSSGSATVAVSVVGAAGEAGRRPAAAAARGRSARRLWCRVRRRRRRLRAEVLGVDLHDHLDAVGDRIAVVEQLDLGPVDRVHPRVGRELHLHPQALPVGARRLPGGGHGGVDDVHLGLQCDVRAVDRLGVAHERGDVGRRELEAQGDGTRPGRRGGVRNGHLHTQLGLAAAGVVGVGEGAAHRSELHLAGRGLRDRRRGLRRGGVSLPGPRSRPARRSSSWSSVRWSGSCPGRRRPSARAASCREGSWRCDGAGSSRRRASARRRRTGRRRAG